MISFTKCFQSGRFQQLRVKLFVIRNLVWIKRAIVTGVASNYKKSFVLLSNPITIIPQPIPLLAYHPTTAKCLTRDFCYNCVKTDGCF